MKFDIKQSDIAKGAAVLLLLWHHLFYSNGVFGSVSSLFSVSGMPVEFVTAHLAKVCVAVFVFISGYGLYFSYKKRISAVQGKSEKLKTGVKFVINRYLKIMKQFWFVYIVFVPLSLAFGIKFYEVYKGNPLNYIADISGTWYWLSDKDSTMNVSWWYITLIIALTVILPLIFPLFEKFPEAFVLAGAIVSLEFASFMNYYPAAFFAGMYAAKRDVFAKLYGLFKNGIQRLLFAVLLLISTMFLKIEISAVKITDGMKVDFIFAFAVIIFSFFVFSKVPFLNKALESIGKRSGLIYMFHTFIYSKFFREELYSLKYALLIFAVLAVACYLIALLLEAVMKYSGYNKLLDKLINLTGEKV